ncbi:MAG: hypothetical protein U9Q07_03945 [Planctomycetota bacterium]|nr:hypothetical protein [Planctomycetota bacterium]
MIKKTIKRTLPYLCTLCDGNGMDPRDKGRSTSPPQCPKCNGTGILQIEELETWEEEEPEKKVFGSQGSTRRTAELGRKRTVENDGKW